MSSPELFQDLAEGLDRLMPPVQRSGDWTDVLRRANLRSRGSRRWSVGRVTVVLAVVGVVVAVAAVAYLIVSHQASRHPRPGALTITVGGHNARWPVKIIEVLSRGRTRVLWQCPVGIGCGEPEGIDWSPDGRRVAFTLDAFNGENSYLGLHVLDIETGRNRLLVAQHDTARLRSPDCPSPAAVAWSPDGRTLAFDCAFLGERSRIWLIGADGSHRRRLSPPGYDASWPSWSPDGTRLAFSAGGIYTIRVDGSDLHHLTTNGSAPAWSPDGKSIAYSTQSGVRLITPEGRDVTDAPATLGPAGVPAWSPQGTQIAIAAEGGNSLYVVDLRGHDLRNVAVHGDIGSLGPRPAWYPAGRSSAPSTNRCQSC